MSIPSIEIVPDTSFRLTFYAERQMVGAPHESMNRAGQALVLLFHHFALAADP